MNGRFFEKGKAPGDLPGDQSRHLFLVNIQVLVVAKLGNGVVVAHPQVLVVFLQYERLRWKF